MSTTYPQFPYSNFPEQIDNFPDAQDVSAELLPLVKQYKALFNSGESVSYTHLVGDYRITDDPVLAENHLRPGHRVDGAAVRPEVVFSQHRVVGDAVIAHPPAGVPRLVLPEQPQHRVRPLGVVNIPDVHRV